MEEKEEIENETYGFDVTSVTCTTLPSMSSYKIY